MLCPSCGTKIVKTTEADPKYCHHCGNTLICSKCGTKYESGAKFCSGCGDDIEEEIKQKCIRKMFVSDEAYENSKKPYPDYQPGQGINVEEDYP